MKKLFAVICLLPSAAFADVTSSMMTTVQIQVNAAGTQVERLGGSYSASGTNVGTTNTGDQVGGFSVNSTTNAVKKLILDLLKALVKTTDNTIDDKIVEMIETKLWPSL